MSKCTIKRNTKGEITNVLKPNGEESKLFKKIAKHPLIKDTEDALGVFKNIYSKRLETANFNNDEDTIESYVLFQHRDSAGNTTDSYKTALENTKEGGLMELGFTTIEEGFIPVVSVRKSTNKDSEVGFAMSMIESGYLSEEKTKVGNEYRHKAAGETETAQTINAFVVVEEAQAHLGVSGVKKDAHTLILKKTKDKALVVNKEGTAESIDNSELDSKTYKELQAEYDNPEDIVAQREWENSRAPYSTSKPQIGEEMPVREPGELELSLLNLLNKLGVRTMSISEYVKKYKIRHGVNPSARALADIANEVVAYTAGEVSELAEETAHFINEALPQGKVENVLRNIHKTQEWAEFNVMYREAYSKEYKGEELEAMVRREVLGKIVAKVILTQNKTPNQTETQKNIFQVVWDTIGEFFSNMYSKYKPQYGRELTQYLKEVNNLMKQEDITDMVELDNFKHNTFKFYSLYDAQDPVNILRGKARQAALKLQEIQKTLVSAGTGSKTDLRKLGKVEKDLKESREEEAIATIISQINYSVKYINAAIKESKSKKNSYFLTGEQNIVFQSLKGVFGKSLAEIETLMNTIKKQEKTNKWDTLIKEAASTATNLRNVIASADLLDSANVERLVDHILDKYNMTGDKRDMLVKWVNKAESDTNLFHATFGQLVHAKDGLLNLQGMLIKDMHNYQQVKFYEATKAFQNKLEELGVTEQEIGNKFVDGQHLISKYDFTKFEAKTDEIYITSYRAAITDSIPKLQSQLASMTGPADVILEIKEKIETYTQYLQETDEKLLELKKSKNLAMLDSAEEVFRKNTERPLMIPEVERVMNDGYYDAYDKKLTDANISESTKQFLSNYVADMAVFRRKAYSVINGARVLDFNSLTEADKVAKSRLENSRKEAKEYTNDIGKLKPGLGYKTTNGTIVTDERGKPIVEVVNPNLITEESRLAIDLNNLDGKFTPGEEQAISLKFYSALDKVDREEGREAALEFLKLNSFLAFTPTFWDNLKLGDSVVTRLESADVDPADTLEVNNLINNITRASYELKSILRRSSAKGNPAEIVVEFMSESAKDTVKTLQEELRDYLSKANAILGEREEEADDTDDYVKGRNEINVAYQKELKDLGIAEDSNDSASEDLVKAGQEVEFAKQHMVAFNANLMENIRISISNFREGNRVGVHTQVKKVLDSMGLSEEQLKDDEVYALVLRQIARARVLPYYKRFAPEAYSELEHGMNTAPNLVDYLVDFEGNKPNQSEAVSDAFVEITPNYTFFDEQENKELNPNYDTEYKGGWLQPKAAKYKNDKFNELFGNVSRAADGTETSTKNSNLFQAYQATLDYNEASLEAMGVGAEYNHYLLPQIRKESVERFTKFLSGDVVKNVKNFTKDVLSYTEDDMVQGEQMFGKEVKIIPKMYVNRLENPDDISTDLFNTLALRAKEAYGREAKVKYYGDLMSVHDKILTRDMNGKDPKSSSTYRMAKSAMDFNIFGIKETATYPLNTPFGVIDLTRIARIMLKYVKFRNLGLNLIIPMTSLVTGEVTRRIEMTVGEFIDTRSQTLGTREYRKLVGSGMTEVGKINTKAKVNVLGQYFKAFDLTESFTHSNYNKWMRFIPRLAMVAHTGANYPLYAKTMLGILHDYRIVDGTVINKNGFKNLRKNQEVSSKDIETEWKSLEGKVLYNYISHEGNKAEIDADSIGKELTKDGIPLTEEEIPGAVQDIFTNVQKNIQYVNSITDGQIPEEDKVLAQRHFLLSYFMTHRGWLSIAIARRFKSRHLNLETALVEEGSYRSVWNYLGGVAREVKGNNYSKFISAFGTAFENGSEIERKNMVRVGIEMAALSSIMLLAMGLRYAAESDDNEDVFALQATNYLAYRTMNELSSVNLNIVSNLGEAIEAPFVGWNTMKNWLDIAAVTSDTEVKSGTYKGMTERSRWLTKMVPGAKQVFDFQNMNQTYDTYRFYNKRNFSLTPVALLWNNTIDAPNE